MEKVRKNISIDQLVKEISEVLPNSQICKYDILHPTPDGVFKFYSHFWSQLVERLNEYKFEEEPEYLNAPEMDPFEEIFLKISLIFKPQTFYFTLEDIYEPQTFRTKYLFKLCAHFIVFIDNIDDIAKQKFKSLSEIFDKMSFAPKENENLLVKIEERAVILSKLKDEYQTVHRDHQDTVDLHEKLEEQKNEREKLHNYKLKQASHLKTELDAKTSNYNQLMNQERNLLEQRVIPDEYKNLQIKLQNLEKELSSIENEKTHYENFLEKNHIRSCNYQESLQIILSYLDIDVDFLNSLLKNEQHLKTLIIQNDSMSKHLGILNEKKGQYCQSQEELEEIRKALIGKLKDSVNSKAIQLELELNCLKTDLQEKQQDQNNLSNRLGKITQAMIRLNEVIFKLNTDVIEIDQRGMERFSQYLLLANKK